MGNGFVALQYLLPQHLLCRIAYALTRCQTGWIKNLLIRRFVRSYRPAMDDALEREPTRYPSFNAFFTRALRDGARSFDPDPRSIGSCCDGTVSNAGLMREAELLQAKGRTYSLEALLAAQQPLLQALRSGSFVTLYLAPSNYHRLHMPLSGHLRCAWHVPGRLFSVNEATAARVPALYARNERVICAFESEHGPFVMVLVGALFVGSISTIWHGQITPARGARGVQPLEAGTHADLWQLRGAEFARFNMGSTVIMLFPPGAVRWDPAAVSGTPVRVGTRLGQLAR
ncbi:MAG TPA: archaetidylserine decarboxylase [Steroidobacteraceae bacterium]|nr:archaetidylserine decarboxylase [Steroidobacteraceae bacterium]